MDRVGLPSIAAAIDLKRYPIAPLLGVRAQALVDACRAQLAATGACLLPGFLTPDAVTVPREVALPPGITYVQLVAGDGFTCARTDIGRTFCWGTAPHGALGNGGVPANLPVIVLATPVP